MLQRLSLFFFIFLSFSSSKLLGVAQHLSHWSCWEERVCSWVFGIGVGGCATTQWSSSLSFVCLWVVALYCLGDEEGGGCQLFLLLSCRADTSQLVTSVKEPSLHKHYLPELGSFIALVWTFFGGGNCAKSCLCVSLFIWWMHCLLQSFGDRDAFVRVDFDEVLNWNTNEAFGTRNSYFIE